VYFLVQAKICVFINSVSATFVVSNNGDDHSISGPFRTLGKGTKKFVRESHKLKAFSTRPTQDYVLYVSLEDGIYELEDTLQFNTVALGRLYLIASNAGQVTIQCNFRDPGINLIVLNQLTLCKPVLQD
jgi:hypothetical protein